MVPDGLGWFRMVRVEGIEAGDPSVINDIRWARFIDFWLEACGVDQAEAGWRRRLQVQVPEGSGAFYKAEWKALEGSS